MLLTTGCAASMHESKIDALFSAYAGRVPGASVGVVEEGKLVFAKSYGLANLEEQTAATPRTNYRLASVTKQFTAMAIMILAERGKLSYDDSISTFFPALPSSITIRHLLTHTSGLLDYEDLIPEGTTRPLLDRDVLDILARQNETYFPAGTRYRYSNSGYAVLALVVERRSGLSFAEFLRANLFVPLGMDSSVAFEEGISTVADRAFGYSRAGDGFHRTDQSLTSSVLGDGGIYASIDDLARWVASLDAKPLVSEERLREATSPLVATDKEGVRYGFGWRIAQDRVQHTGETIGFRNALVRFPARKLAVIVLTNRNEGEPIELALQVAEVWSNRTPQ